MPMVSRGACGVPRTRALGAFVEGWRLLGYVREGRDHTAKGQPCQDAIATGIQDSILWFAVADGLGSAEKSQIGAELAARHVGEALRIEATRGLPSTEWDATISGLSTLTSLGESVAESVSDALFKLASHLEVERGSLATTLQFVLIDTITSDFVYNAIGDGHCIYRASDGSSRILGADRIATEYGAPHILLETWKKFFYQESGHLEPGTLLITFTDGLDPLFVRRANNESESKGASSASVNAFNGLFSDEYNENKAIFAASQTIDQERYVDSITDDVAFVAISWRAKCEIASISAQDTGSETPSYVEPTDVRSPWWSNWWRR
jgi:hypothetical protein